MKLLDVNILVQVHREDADLHKEMSGWLSEQLRAPAGVAVSELVLSGFLRIVTHTKIFQVPSPLVRAIEFVEDLRSRQNVHILAPGNAHWKIFLELCRTGDARGNHIPDAYHAALALEVGCEWVTLDRGFRRYPDLRIIFPQ